MCTDTTDTLCVYFMCVLCVYMCVYYVCTSCVYWRYRHFVAATLVRDTSFGGQDGQGIFENLFNQEWAFIAWWMYLECVLNGYYTPSMHAPLRMKVASIIHILFQNVVLLVYSVPRWKFFCTSRLINNILLRAQVWSKALMRFCSLSLPTNLYVLLRGFHQLLLRILSLAFNFCASQEHQVLLFRMMITKSVWIHKII